MKRLKKVAVPRQPADIVLGSAAMNAPDPKYLVILSGVTFAGVAAWAGWALMKFKEPWAVAGDAPVDDADDEKPAKASKPAEKLAATKAAPAEADESDDEDDESDESDESENAQKKG
jgi:hypothetical protein